MIFCTRFFVGFFANDFLSEKIQLMSTKWLWAKLHSQTFRLNIDWEIYKEARNDIQRTIKLKKKQYLEEKLSENIAKPKELWGYR